MRLLRSLPEKRAWFTFPSWKINRVEKVEDVVSVGDEIVVMVTEIDQQGRINLSRKDALAKLEAKKAADAQ